MIVISAGMQKSGSAWYFNLTNDLLIAAGRQNIREIRKKYQLQSILEGKNCNIGNLTWKKLYLLIKHHFLRNSFVVKTHYPPIKLLYPFVFLHIVKVTYIYRDPRDVILSALDHGRWLRGAGKDEALLASFTSTSEFLPVIKEWLRIWEKWSQFHNVHLVRYENLIMTPLDELKRLARYLSIDTQVVDLNTILRKYTPENAPKYAFKHLHYNKGVMERFRQEMLPEDRELCHKYLGQYIEKMGYPL